MPVTPASLNAALERADRYLTASPVLEALLARGESGRHDAEDEEAAAELAQEISLLQAEDGSWGGHLAHTAETLLLLGDLLPAQRTHESATRATSWLAARIDQPGAFGTACDADLHAVELCGHHVSGFFAPAAPQASMQDTTLGRGVCFRTDRDARLGTSALALRAWLRWREPSAPLQEQINALARVASLGFRPGKPNLFGAAALAETLLALVAAPRTAAIMAALHSSLSRMAATQRADGTFPEVSTFAVLDVLLRSARAGYSSPIFDAAIQRAVEMLVVSQQANGSWGKDVTPYFTLVGWRALRAAAPHTVTS